MSEVLNVETLRNKILRLIAEAISDSNSDLAKTLNTKINALAKAAIDSDNENDINWDETDELFGDYNGNNSNPTPTPTSTPTSTPSSTPSSTPQMYTTMPPLTVKAHNGGSFNPGHVILTIEGNGGTVTDKIEVKRLPYNGSLTFDAPQIVISSPRYTWSIKYGNGSSATYHAGMECIMGSGYLYNAIITVNTESSPETT
jgi:hypothetical protein